MQAPKALSDESVSITILSYKLNHFHTGFLLNCFLSSRKAYSTLLFLTKLVSPFARPVKLIITPEHSPINLRQKFANPKKNKTPEIFFGIGQSIITRNSLGSILTPSFKITYPRYSTL